MKLLNETLMGDLNEFANGKDISVENHRHLVRLGMLEKLHSSYVVSMEGGYALVTGFHEQPYVYVMGLKVVMEQNGDQEWIASTEWGKVIASAKSRVGAYYEAFKWIDRRLPQEIRLAEAMSELYRRLNHSELIDSFANLELVTMPVDALEAWFSQKMANAAREVHALSVLEGENV